MLLKLTWIRLSFTEVMVRDVLLLNIVIGSAFPFFFIFFNIRLNSWVATFNEKAILNLRLKWYTLKPLYLRQLKTY